MTKLETTLYEALQEMIRVWPVSVCDSPMCGHCLERKTAVLNAKIATALYRNTDTVEAAYEEVPILDELRGVTAAEVLASKENPPAVADFAKLNTEILAPIVERLERAETVMTGFDGITRPAQRHAFVTKNGTYCEICRESDRHSIHTRPGERANDADDR